MTIRDLIHHLESLAAQAEQGGKRQVSKSLRSAAGHLETFGELSTSSLLEHLRAQAPAQPRRSRPSTNTRRGGIDPAAVQELSAAIVRKFGVLREQAHAGRLSTSDVELFKAHVLKAPVPAVNQALAELEESPKSRPKAAEALAKILETSQKRAVRI